VIPKKLKGKIIVRMIWGKKYGEKQFHFHLLVMKIEEARSAKLIQLLYRQA
jgi:hypothetical protein